MQKQINIVLKGKGGVGKSFFATNFSKYLKDHQIDHRAIDTDNENSTLKRFHPDAEPLTLKTPKMNLLDLFTAASDELLEAHSRWP